MLIKVEDLKVGDEIIISSYSNLKYLKVLKAPRIKETSYKGDPIYASLKCSICQKTNEYFTKSGLKYTRKEYVFEEDSTKHNTIIYVNLNEKGIYLVKRNN